MRYENQDGTIKLELKERLEPADIELILRWVFWHSGYGVEAIEKALKSAVTTWIEMVNTPNAKLKDYLYPTKFISGESNDSPG